MRSLSKEARGAPRASLLIPGLEMGGKAVGIRQRRTAGDRGQSVVELALILPVLCLLLFGMAEFARMASNYLTVQHAAREGLRLGVTGGTDSQIRDRVIAMAGVLDPVKVQVTVDPANAPRTPGSDLQVTVAYQFEMMTKLIGDITGATPVLKSTVISRVE